VPSPVPVRRTRVAGLRHPEAPATTPGADAPRTDRPVDEPGSTEVTQVIPPVRDEPAAAVRAEPASAGPEPEVPAEPEAPAARKVAPTRRPRSRPRPAPEPEAVVGEPVTEPDVDQEEPRRRSTWLVPAVLAVVVVLLGGVATWSALEWSHLRSGAGANTALTDNAGTSEVLGQVTSAVNTTFSLNYTDVGKTEKAAQSLLTGAALCQYNALFKAIQQQAPSEKLVLTTTVTSKGLQMLQGDTARVVLLVDQKDTKVATNQPVESQATLAVNVVKQDGKWKISNIDTFNGAATTPGCPAN
jgi:Mce-associated membrane protein